MLFRKPRSRIARAFYCDVLRGRQVRGGRRDVASLSFIVQGTRIDVDTHGNDEDGQAVVLAVPDPRAVAERCWDAGYSVRVGDDASGEPAVAVIDPFGRRIDLVR